MPWTAEQKIDALMRLPWSVSTQKSAYGSYLTARIAEVSDAIATAADERSLARELFASLRASLSCRIDYGDEIPLPEGFQLPWKEAEEPRGVPSLYVLPLHEGQAWQRPILRSTGAYRKINSSLAPA